MLDEEPVLAVNEIQGDIIPGFKNDFQTFVFLLIEDVPSAKQWFKSLSTQLSSAAELQAANRLFSLMRHRLGRDPTNLNVRWLNIAFSASGLIKLTSHEEVESFEDDAFKKGMALNSALLGDAVDAVDSWLIGGPRTPIDAVLILASDDKDDLATEVDALVSQAAGAGLRHIRTEVGAVRKGDDAGHEHFGFKDGISMPAVRGRASEQVGDFFFPRSIPSGDLFKDYSIDFARPGQPLVWPGHFLFGYGRQFRQEPRRYNPSNGPIGPEWAKNGSFLVFRRLTQDVPGFWKGIEQSRVTVDQQLPDLMLNNELLASLMVGRWKSGTPIARSPSLDLGIQGDAANYFAFTQSPPASLPGDDFPSAEPDDNGITCPLGAHIRKVNPRDQETDQGVAANTLPKLILRRGIPFGPSWDSNAPESANCERGLLFVCFQSSIETQFQFLMNTWVNQTNKPIDDSGEDPIIGTTSRARTFVLRSHTDKQFRIPLVDGFVQATGGEYFFAPSIAWFSRLIS